MALLLAIVGLATQDPDPMSVALAWAVFTTVTNGGVLLRRSGRPEPASARERLPEAALEMDARRILEIDARLDALERAEDRRLRMLAVEGAATGPAAEAHEAPSPGLNGRA